MLLRLPQSGYLRLPQGGYLRLPALAAPRGADAFTCGRLAVRPRTAGALYVMPSLVGKINVRARTDGDFDMAEC